MGVQKSVTLEALDDLMILDLVARDCVSHLPDIHIVSFTCLGYDLSTEVGRGTVLYFCMHNAQAS